MHSSLLFKWSLLRVFRNVWWSFRGSGTILHGDDLTKLIYLRARLSIVSAPIVTSGAFIRASAHDAQWLSSGFNIENTRFNNKEFEITPRNVARLKVNWIFDTGGDVSATPAVDRDAVYVPDWAGNFFKIDSETGKQIWRHQISEYTGQKFNFSRTAPAISGDRVVIGLQDGDPVIGATVLAVSRQTGELLWKTTIDTHPSS